MAPTSRHLTDPHQQGRSRSNGRGILILPSLNDDDDIAAADSQVDDNQLRLVVSRPEMGNRIDIEWNCDVTEGVQTSQREGHSTFIDREETIFQMSGDRMTCSVWKRSPGYLVVNLYRGDELEDSVNSNSTETDLMIVTSGLF